MIVRISLNANVIVSPRVIEKSTLQPIEKSGTVELKKRRDLVIKKSERALMVHLKTKAAFNLHFICSLFEVLIVPTYYRLCFQWLSACRIVMSAFVSSGPFMGIESGHLPVSSSFPRYPSYLHERTGSPRMIARGRDSRLAHIIFSARLFHVQSILQYILIRERQTPC